MKNIVDSIKDAGKKIGKAALPLAIAAIPYVSNAQQHYGVPDSEWQNQRQHPDIGHNYFGLNKLDYDGSGDANNDEVVDTQDAEAIRAGNDSYRADVARPFGVVDEADAQKIEDYVNGDAKIIGKDFYTTDKGITNQERIDYIVDKFNDVLIKKMVNNVENSVGGLNMKYSGFNCAGYSELAQNYFQGWVDPEAFFEKYWYGEAKKTIDSVYNYNYNGRFNLQTNNIGVKSGDPNNDDYDVSHSLIEFPLVGDLTKKENNLWIDAATGRRIVPGDFLFKFKNSNEYTTQWVGNSKSWGPIRGPPIINRIFKEDGTVETTWKNPDYNFYEDTVTTGIKNINKDEKKSLDLDVYNNGYINIETQRAGEANVKVFSINGKMLEDRIINTNTGNNMIDFGFEPKNNGMYIFVVTDKFGNKDVVKTVK